MPFLSKLNINSSLSVLKLLLQSPKPNYRAIKITYFRNWTVDIKKKRGNITLRRNKKRI